MKKVDFFLIFFIYFKTKKKRVAMSTITTRLAYKNKLFTPCQSSSLARRRSYVGIRASRLQTPYGRPLLVPCVPW